jgi:hypothetical protein
MVLSFWKQFHPDIKVLPATKLSYGLYPYKVVLSIKGAAMLRNSSAFETQMSARRNINYGGSWRRPVEPSARDLVLLERIRSWNMNIPVDVKMRIEDSSVQIYSTNQPTLVAFVKSIFEPEDRERIVSISAPADQKALDIIQAGYTYNPKRDLNYRFRVNIRDGRYDIETRANLLSILESQGDQVRVPPGTRKMMEKTNGEYIWGAYFYCNDENVNLLFALVCPTFIRNIDRYYSDDTPAE